MWKQGFIFLFVIFFFISWFFCVVEDIAFTKQFIPTLYEELIADIDNVKVEYGVVLPFFSNKEIWKTNKNITFEDYCYARTMVSSRW
jgi:hypothetical protein